MAPNSDDNWLKPLLDSLQGLYSQLSALILNRRMNAYRKEGSAHSDTQILSALYDFVEKSSEPQKLDAVKAGSTPVAKTDGVSSAVLNRTPGINSSPATSHTDLSNHLHTNLSKTSDSEHLGVKLKTTAWDHIHTSLRYVREGKADLAKMHADLANEALQQASHHMKDEDYITLKTSILAELKKLRK